MHAACERKSYSVSKRTDDLLPVLYMIHDTAGTHFNASFSLCSEKLTRKLCTLKHNGSQTVVLLNHQLKLGPPPPCGMTDDCRKSKQLKCMEFGGEIVQLIVCAHYVPLLYMDISTFCSDILSRCEKRRHRHTCCD